MRLSLAHKRYYLCATTTIAAAAAATTSMYYYHYIMEKRSLWRHECDIIGDLLLTLVLKSDTWLDVAAHVRESSSMTTVGQRSLMKSDHVGARENGNVRDDLNTSTVHTSASSSLISWRGYT